MSADENPPAGTPGVAEEAAGFEPLAEEDSWAIAQARLAQHDRGGVGTMSIEKVGDVLRKEIGRLRAEKA